MCKNEGGQPGNNNARKWWKLDGLIIGYKLLEWMRKKSYTDLYMEEFFYMDNDYPINVETKLMDADETELYNRKTMDKYGFKTQKSVKEFFEKNDMSLEESFSTLYSKALKIQEMKLKKGASIKKLDSGTVKFILMNCHGWVDRQDNTTKGEKIDNMIQVEILKPKKD